ncbi:MAG: TlpA family protein disulfide reductase [Rhodanobacteraceae bacterium]
MKFKLVRFACVAIALLLASHATGVDAQAQAVALPNLVVSTLDGKTFDLTAHRGQWVIVNFWATWCSPCIAEMPAISEYVAAHKHVTAIGLAWEDASRDELVNFAKKHPVDYPLAQIDISHPPADFAPPAALPTTYLIAPDGAVARHFLGPVDAKVLDAAIAAASAHRPLVPTSAAKR